MNTRSENHFSRRLNSCSHSKHSSRSFGPSCLRTFGEPLCRRNCEPVRRIQAKTNRGTMWLAMSGFASPQRAHTGGRFVIDSAPPIASAGLNLVTQPPHALPQPSRSEFPLNIPPVLVDRQESTSVSAFKRVIQTFLLNALATVFALSDAKCFVSMVYNAFRERYDPESVLETLKPIC